MSRRSVRRAGPKRFNAAGQSRVYTFQRSADVTLYNGKTIVGTPQVQTDNVNYLAVGAADTTTHTEPNHTNFGIFFTDRLNQLQNMAEYGALFQYFRIAKITRRWVPIYAVGGRERGYYNENTAGPDTQSMGAFGVPTLMSLTDKDDATVLTMAAAREATGTRFRRMTGAFTETFTPVPAMPIGSTTAGASLFAVVPKRMPWVSYDDAQAVQVYGKRYGILDWPGPSDGVGDVLGNTVPYGWRIYSTYTVQFKGAR